MAPKKRTYWGLSTTVGGPMLLVGVGVVVVALLLYLVPETRPQVATQVGAPAMYECRCTCDRLDGGALCAVEPSNSAICPDYNYDFGDTDEASCLSHNDDTCLGYASQDSDIDPWLETAGTLGCQWVAVASPTPSPSSAPSPSGNPPPPPSSPSPSPSPQPSPTPKKLNKCPSAYLVGSDGTVAFQQNLLKGRIAAGSEGTTYERLRTQDLTTPTTVRIAEENAGEVTYLNSLNLLALHHEAGTDAYIDQYGEPYQLTTASAVDVTTTTAGGEDIYTISTHGAPALLLTASLNIDFLNTVRNTLMDDARLQCLPGLYDLVDQLPAQATANVVRKIGGIAVTDQAGNSLTDFPVILEHSETTLLTFPAGTTRVTFTTPHGAYDIEQVTAVTTLTPITTVDRYAPTDSAAAAAIDDTRQRITAATPVTLTFAPASVDTPVTYYFASHGYYHYAEEAQCDAPSYRYDVLWEYAGE